MLIHDSNGQMAESVADSRFIFLIFPQTSDHSDGGRYVRCNLAASKIFASSLITAGKCVYPYLELLLQ